MKLSSRLAAAAAVLVTVLVSPAKGQTYLPPPVHSVELSGPRLGLTVLDRGVLDRLADRSISVRPVISQFGWQLEKQFFTKSSGLTAVNEWVLLVGGLEQSVALPSATWMVGVRTSSGTEFGIGPNLTPAGLALAVATGVTFRTGPMNVPVNLAVVPSKVGMRVSVLTGFTMRRR
jgi:hypothetical protein